MNEMAVGEVSKMWGDLNERLDALSVEDYEFLLSDVFRYVIYLKGKFDWAASGNPQVFPMLPVPKSDILEKYNLQVNTVMYVSELSHMIAHWGFHQGWNVIEIGGGFGNFCRVFHELLRPSGYSIVDTPSMSRFAQKFLAHYGMGHVRHLPHMGYAAGMNYDLFVSNICLSELTPEYRQEIFDCIMPLCKRCFIIDGDGKNDSFNKWLEDEVRANFNDVRIHDIDTPWKVRVYMGEK